MYLMLQQSSHARVQFLHVCLILAPQLPKAHLPETVHVDWNLHDVPEEINSADWNQNDAFEKWKMWD